MCRAFEEEVLARKKWLYLEVDFLGDLNRKAFVCGDSIVNIVIYIDKCLWYFKKKLNRVDLGHLERTFEK